MARAAKISQRLKDANPDEWYRQLALANIEGMTLLEYIERRVQEWEMHLKNQGAIPQERAPEETTEVVIDLDLAKYLREAMKQKAFMKDDFIDEIFAYAKELAHRDAWRRTQEGMR